MMEKITASYSEYLENIQKFDPDVKPWTRAEFDKRIAGLKLELSEPDVELTIDESGRLWKLIA